MAAIVFDTLKCAHRLTDAGMPQNQAEASAEALKEAVSESQRVTRSDIHELKIDLIKWMVWAC